MFKPLWKSQKGFTLIETLVAFTIFSFCLLLLVSSALIMNKGSDLLVYNEDKIAQMQLQSLVAQGSKWQIVDTMFVFQYRGKEVYLEQYLDKLIKRPGFEVFLQGIDEGSMQHEGGCYQFVYTRQQTTNKIVLGCE